MRIICQRWKHRKVERGWQRLGDQKTNTEVKLSWKNEFLWYFSRSIMTGPGPRPSLGHSQIKHSEYLLTWFTEQHSQLLYREEDVVVDVWVKLPQVTSELHFYKAISLQPTHVCLWMCSTDLQKQHVDIVSALCQFHAAVTQLLSCFGLSSP